MATAHLTDRKLQSLSTSRVQEDFWDDGLSGFGVRVSSKGRKTFVVMYRCSGVKRRMTLGTYPALSLADARQQAMAILVDVARGGDPATQKRADREGLRFEDLVEEYFERHGRHHLRASTLRGNQQVLRRNVIPRFRGRLASEIKRQDVIALLDDVVARGAPVVANEVRAVVSKIYNWGIGRDLVEHNPCFAVARPSKQRSRDRVLSIEEIRAVWAGLGSLNPLFAGTFKLRLLTAQRGAEVVNLRWEQIDGDWWTIPQEISKNHRSHRVFLPAQTRAVLEQMRPLGEGSPWVFPSSRDAAGHITKVDPACRRLIAVSGVKFCPHDLRRTAASHITAMGIPRLVVAKVLNHTSPDSSVTAVYDRYSYAREQQEALTRWGARLEEVLGELADFELGRLEEL